MTPIVWSVGSSFTHFAENGFWSRDAFIEAWLALLVDVLDEASASPPWQAAVLDEWTVQAAAGFNGFVSPQLDWLLFDQDRVGAILEASRTARLRLAPTASPLFPDIPWFDERAERMFHGHAPNKPGVGNLDGLLQYADAFDALLRRELIAPPSAALFVGGGPNHYGGEPPELVVRQWLAEADAPSEVFEPRGYRSQSVAQQLTVRVTESVERHGWRVEAREAYLPAAILVDLFRRIDDAPAETEQVRATLVVSAFGGLFSVFLHRRFGSEFRFLQEVRLPRDLLLHDRRYVAATLLTSHTYDGQNPDVPPRSATTEHAPGGIDTSARLPSHHDHRRTITVRTNSTLPAISPFARRGYACVIWDADRPGLGLSRALHPRPAQKARCWSGEGGRQHAGVARRGSVVRDARGHRVFGHH